MYSRTMPMPDDEKGEEKPSFDEKKDACNPDNFSLTDDEEVVRI